MKNVVTFVLGGGRGTRLYPLTKYRAKPAVPLAGKYRLIDIPLSNCLNSGLNRIFVLTQFLSVSLHRHIRQTYRFDHFSGGYVELLAAQQTMDEGTDWYQGTADAVRKNVRYLQQPGVDYVLILSGDQLYRMDYRKMIETHEQAKADVTIAALPVSSTAASGLGIMALFNGLGRLAWGSLSDKLGLKVARAGVITGFNAAAVAMELGTERPLRGSLLSWGWGGERVFDVDRCVKLAWVEILGPEQMASCVLGSRQDSGVPVVDLVTVLQLQRAANQRGRDLHHFERFQEQQLPQDRVGILSKFATGHHRILLHHLGRDDARALTHCRSD